MNTDRKRRLAVRIRTIQVALDQVLCELELPENADARRQQLVEALELESLRRPARKELP